MHNINTCRYADLLSIDTITTEDSILEMKYISEIVAITEPNKSINNDKTVDQLIEI